MRYAFLHTKDALSVNIEGKPYVVSSAHPMFKDIVRSVGAGEEPSKVIALMELARTSVIGFVKQLKHMDLGDNLVYEDGVLLMDGTPIEDAGAKHLVELIEMGHDYTAMSAFIKRLSKNPDSRIVDVLFEFLKVGRIPLTRDGCFLTYKAVREDFKDIHSGTFLNSVGQVVSIPRETCDNNPDNLCSAGLHVCSYGYLPSFAHANGHVMMCKVDPTDVVSVPREYSLTKMRVCKYEVVSEVTTYYQAGKDVLSEERLRDPRYLVFYKTSELYEPEVEDEYYTVEEAILQADTLKRSNAGLDEVYVVDRETDKEVYHA